MKARRWRVQDQETENEIDTFDTYSEAEDGLEGAIQDDIECDVFTNNSYEIIEV